MTDIGRLRFGPDPDAPRDEKPLDVESMEFVTEREPLIHKEAAPKRQKGIYIGAPACFALEMACKHVRDAFGNEADFAGIYIVGSCLERPDWRDVDVRMMLDDKAFQELFPSACLISGSWEFDPRWTLLTVAISNWMRQQTGLPIDFQFQPMTHANAQHKGRRNAVGITVLRSDAQTGGIAGGAA